MSEEQSTTARRGSIGAEIFEQVEKLVESEGLTRTQAFERISEETGRRSGTVAANYYRVARQRGASLQPRRRRGNGRRAGGPRGGAEAALQRAQDALNDLATIVRQQDKELEQLREQAAQFAKFKKWIDKNA
jgi:hypothetical protein